MASTESHRPIDRERRSKIIDATIEVLAEHGVQGLRHRRVAEAAGVPLGATTYYFASLDDLLEAAMARAVARDLERLAARLERADGDDGLVEALVELLLEATSSGRDSEIVSSELYAAALRKEGLREVVIRWDEGWAQLLTPRLGRRRARLLSIAVGGLLQQELIRGGAPARDELRELIRLLVIMDRRGSTG